jgi:tRNA dimethylallyltransferase
MPPIIVIAGPTATQKSKLALELAKQIDGIIINSDSRQVYKELQIGTAQPQPDYIINKDNQWIIEDIPHYMYGYTSITQKFNLYTYQKDVYSLLKQLDKPAILVGGTGLYIDAVVFGYKLVEAPPKERSSLQKLSISELWDQIPKSLLSKLNESDKYNP